MLKKNFNVPQHKTKPQNTKVQAESLKQKVQQYNQQIKQKQESEQQKSLNINIPIPRNRIQQKKFIVYSDQFDKDSLILKILFQRPWWRFSPNIADANMILVANTPKIGLFNQRASERCIINSLPRSEVILDYIYMYQTVTNAMGNTAYQFLNVSYNITHNSSKFLNHFKYLESFILGTNNKFQYNPKLHDQLVEQNNAYENQLEQQQRQLRLEKKMGPTNQWNNLLYSSGPNQTNTKITVKQSTQIQNFRQDIEKQRNIANSSRYKGIQYDYKRRIKNKENHIVEEITSPVRRMQIQEETNEMLWGQMSQFANQINEMEDTDQENTGGYSQDDWQLVEQNNNSRLYQVNQSQVNDSFQELQNSKNQNESPSRAASREQQGNLVNQSINMTIDDLQPANTLTPQHNRVKSGPSAYRLHSVMQTPDIMKTPRQYLDEHSLARRSARPGSVSILFHSRADQGNNMSLNRSSVQSRPQSVNYKGRTIVCQQPWQSRAQSRVQSVNYYSRDYSTRGSIRRDVRVQSGSSCKKIRQAQEITSEQMDLLLTSHNVNKHEPVKHSQKSTLKFNQSSAANVFHQMQGQNMKKQHKNAVKLPFEYEYTPPIFNKLNVWRIIQNNRTLLEMNRFRDVEKINPNKGVTVAQKAVEWQLQYKGRNITLHFYTLIKQNGDIFIYKTPLARLSTPESIDEVADDAETGCTKNKDINYIKVTQLDQAALERCQITDFTKKLFIQIKFIISKILYFTSRERLGRGAPSKNSFLLLEFQFKLSSEGHPMLYIIKNATHMPYGNAPCFDFFSKLIDDMFDLTIDRVFVDVDMYVKEYENNQSVIEYESQIEKKRRQLKGQSSSYSAIDYNKYDVIDLLAEIPEKERQLEHLRFSKCGRKENLFEQIAHKWLFS